MTTFLLVMLLHGNRPSTPTYLVRFDKHLASVHMIFFGRPLTKAFWEGYTIPNFHSVSDRCRLLHPVLCSLHAGQTVMYL
jgi:hypothetical protein